MIQFNLLLGYNKVHAFPKGISSKGNVKALLELELAQYARGFPPTEMGGDYFLNMIQFNNRLLLVEAPSDVIEIVVKNWHP